MAPIKLIASNCNVKVASINFIPPKNKIISLDRTIRPALIGIKIRVTTESI